MNSSLHVVARRSPETEPASSAFPAFLALALALHLATVRAVPPYSVEHRPLPALPLEIALAPPPAPTEPPPPPPPTRTEAAARLATTAPTQRTPHAPRAEPAGPAARAGALLHANEATSADELVSFVTDEHGSSYGSGVVARGGAADHGTGPQHRAAVSFPAPPASHREGGGGLTAEGDLSRKPALDEPDPCRGYFPSSAASDHGTVSLAVVVRPDGRVAQAVVVGETPPGEGFGAAARACVLAQRFAPALARDGRPTATATAVRLRFTR